MAPQAHPQPPSTTYAVLPGVVGARSVEPSFRAWSYFHPTPTPSLRFSHAGRGDAQIPKAGRWLRPRVLTLAGAMHGRMLRAHRPIYSPAGKRDALALAAVSFIRAQNIGPEQVDLGQTLQGLGRPRVPPRHRFTPTRGLQILLPHRPAARSRHLQSSNVSVPRGHQ
jgi:hypothetical protein